MADDPKTPDEKNSPDPQSPNAEKAQDAQPDTKPADADAQASASGAPSVPDGDVVAAPVIAAFGGIRPTANKLGIPVSTVQGWKQRNTIPAQRIAEIQSAARADSIDLTLEAVPADDDASASTTTTETTARPSGSAVARASTPGRASAPGRTPRSGARASQPTRSGQPTRPGRPREPMRVMPITEPSGSSGPSGGSGPSGSTSGSAGTGGPSSAGSGQSSSGPSTPATPTPPTPPTPPVPPAHTDETSGGRGLLVGLLLVLLFAAVWPIVYPMLAGDADAGGADADALSAEIADLQQRLDAVEAAGGAGDDAAVAELREALDAVQANVANLGGTSDQIDALNGEITELKASLAAVAGAVGDDNGGTVDPALFAGIGTRLDDLTAQLGAMQNVIAALEGHVETLGGQVAAVEEQAGSNAQDLAQVGEATDALSASLAEVQAALDAARGEMQSMAETLLADLDAATDNLSQRIDILANRDDAAADGQAVLIALGQLDDRLRSPDPFATELESLAAIIAARPELASRLDPTLAGVQEAVGDAATTGVPTLRSLRMEFDDVRRAVLQADPEPPEDTIDEVLSEVSDLVTISRIDETGYQSVDAILVTADEHLAAGDLGSAVEAMAALDNFGPGYAAAAADWLADARLRVAVDAAMADMQAAALEAFRPTDPGTPDSDSE